MKSLVVYDSNYGNTQKIAEAIARELETSAVIISQINPGELSGLELLVVGTPIIGWKPTVKMQGFLSNIEKQQLKGVKAATFDTRVKMFIHGDAMGKVAEILKSAGAEIVAQSMPFYVAGPQKAPYLLKNELEKAKGWALEIKKKAGNK